MHPRRSLPVSHQLEVVSQQRQLHLSELLYSGLLYIDHVQVGLTSSTVLSMFCVIIYATGERYVQTVLFCTC